MYDPNKIDLLLVDDDDGFRSSVARRFIRRGFRVQEGSNGEEALALAERRNFDAAVLDMVMPGLSGVQVLEKLKASRPDCEVIMLTGQASIETAVQAMKLGAYDYLKKPFPLGELELMIQKAYEHGQARKEGENSQLEPSCLVEAIKHYRLTNQPELIPPLVGRLLVDLKQLKLFDATEEVRIATALREALMNAIEHGNLEVSSTLRESDDESYTRLIEERSHQTPYAERQVHLVAKESAGEVIYVVQDEGPGFNPDDLPDPTDLENLEKASGRGLLLIRSFMDSVTYNDRGNQITMVKRQRSPEAVAS